MTCALHPTFLCCVVSLEVPSLLPGSWEAPGRGLGRTAQHGPSREEPLGTERLLVIRVSGCLVWSVYFLWLACYLCFGFNKEAARVHFSMSYRHNFIWNVWRIFHQVFA